MTLKLDGIFPPLPTSFYENEKLACGMMQDNIRKLSQFDLAGFLVLGSNGELVNLSEKERFRIYSLAREALSKDKILLIGTGGQTTRETISNNTLAAISGADAVLVLSPFYYKSLMTRKALIEHYWAIADVSKVPVIIYNMPASTGIDMDAETIVQISAHKNIIGLKDSGGNMVKMGDIKRMANPDFQILAGSAGFLLPALSVGAIGGILALANIAPKQCISIYNNYLSGNIEEARKIQLELIPVNTAVTSRWGIPALKKAMDHMGLYGGPARKPIQPISPETEKELIELIDKHL